VGWYVPGNAHTDIVFLTIVSPKVVSWLYAMVIGGSKGVCDGCMNGEFESSRSVAHEGLSRLRHETTNECGMASEYQHFAVTSLD